MSNPTTSVILITGCSTGLGRCIAEESLARGLQVIATARRLLSIEDLRVKGAKVFQLDVTSPPDELKKFAEDAIGAFGKVDILVNNAGYLLGGAIEENSPKEIESLFNTNFFSVINLTTAFLPHFRGRKSGTIVNISSQGGYIALSGAGIYCASKAALDCITDVWSKELAPFNIRATSIVLGAFRTAVSGTNSQAPAKEIPGYDAAHDILRGLRERGGHEIGDAVKGAKKLLDVVLLKTDRPLPARFALGEDAVALSEKLLRKRLEDLDEWKEYGVGTNVDGVKYEQADW